VRSAAAPLAFIGDAVHNFLDGDVAVLLAAGYSRRRALLLNVVTGAASLAPVLLITAAIGTIVLFERMIG
jgi:zinc transporter ZupT